MALLLDTCVAVWFFEGSDRIPPVVLSRLRDPAENLHFSHVSILEIVIKYQLGKFPLPQPPSRLLLPLANRHMMGILPLEPEAIFRLERLPDLHRDPFDRLLVAQALAHRLTLVSPDPLVRQYPVPVLWD
jgi:PIN domain nuclease of toxin-antitoxin system